VRGRGTVDVTLLSSATAGPAARRLLGEHGRRSVREPWAIEAQRSGGDVVGVATGTRHHGICTVEELVVVESSRAMGIGNYLLTEVERLAESRGCDELRVDARNEPQPQDWVGEWLQRRGFRRQPSGLFARWGIPTRA
jgi:GNAT superfamily N-acetyltransferase